VSDTRDASHGPIRSVLVRLADIGLWISATIGLAAAVASAVMFLSGMRPLVVTSGSMEPAYPVRSLAVVSPVDAASVGKGDVVAVRLPSGARVLHRVTDVHVVDGGRRAVTLKGDANEKPDGEPVVLDDRAYRSVTCIPYLGMVASWLRTPMFGFVAALVLLGPLALRRRSGPAAAAGTPQPA
jgi:signal peptidase I